MRVPQSHEESGEDLLRLWRQYLQDYAEAEGNLEQQIIDGAYRSAEVLAVLSRKMDRNGRWAGVINQRNGYFEEGGRRAQVFEDRLITATFTLYNHFNTLAHEFTEENVEAGNLISQIDAGVQERMEGAAPVERCAAAMEASFPLLVLMTLALDPMEEMTGAVRELEVRFSSSLGRTSSPSERLVNALYRVVEILQLFTVASESELRDPAGEIAARFQEEDRSPELGHKLRNGFCRLFELSHLAATQLNNVLDA